MIMMMMIIIIIIIVIIIDQSLKMWILFRFSNNMFKTIYVKKKKKNI